jgi:C4-dicarboxylate-specific signal transduction histidine kinase
VERIAEQALRAGEVLRRLRDFARKGEARPATCDVGRLVLDALRLAEVDARRHDARIEIDLEPDLPPVQADGIQLQQVVLNLVRNALEAMDGQPPAERRLVVRAARAGADGVEVSVADRGAGLAEGAEAQLFHPFYTTKADGLGMGLSISHSIVSAHGGAMTFSRNADGGSTFRFTLPAGRESPA